MIPLETVLCEYQVSMLEPSKTKQEMTVDVVWGPERKTVTFRADQVAFLGVVQIADVPEPTYAHS